MSVCELGIESYKTPPKELKYQNRTLVRLIELNMSSEPIYIGMTLIWHRRYIIYKILASQASAETY